MPVAAGVEKKEPSTSVHGRGNEERRRAETSPCAREQKPRNQRQRRFAARGHGESTMRALKAANCRESLEHQQQRRRRRQQRDSSAVRGKTQGSGSGPTRR
ncbi:hypothetical protein AOLI_G00239570 [Acnodon oligacanthus]